MIFNYFKIAWRGLRNNTIFSVINITGLAAGAGVVMLIGMWIYDELHFNRYHKNYEHIAQVMRHSTSNDEISTRESMPIPLRDALGNKYQDEFKHIVLATPVADHILAFADQKFTVKGRFMEPATPEMLSFEMLRGSSAGLKNLSSIMLSESLSKTLFSDRDPVGKTLMIDNKMEAIVTGVYKDLPYNSRFRDLAFVAPWQLHLSNNESAQKAQQNWGRNSFEIYVEIAGNAQIASINDKIRNIVRDHTDPKLAEMRKPEVFLYPMSRWHLHSEWKNGVNVGGRIQFVWFFGTIAGFVLLLACINFMNLSTARSEKRAKEVGIRKVVGSARSQLMKQFFSESILLATIGFVFALILVEFTLPFFNELADKRMSLMWSEPWFWITGLGFTLFTGLIAGSYPALYLSSFRPIKVLRGTVHLGRFAATPRKALVILQFTVSTSLIIGTMVVHNQIQFAKDRPVGYNRDGLLIIPMSTPETHKHYESIRSELLETGVVIDVAASQNPTTEVWDTRNGFIWSGDDSNRETRFATMAVTHEYGKTVGWKFSAGRDFSKDFSTDLSTSLVLNAAAAKEMGFENPIGQSVWWGGGGDELKIIGVIDDMLMTSPYDPVEPTIFYLNYDNANFINVKIDPAAGAHDALARIGNVFKKYNPSAPFDYKFAEQEYALKFAGEERIGKLTNVFTALAIFISCLGIFGLASFIAEQRTREIGIRKILGASVFSLWKLLSRDFVWLVLISCLIAIPVSNYLLGQWLLKYQYRTEMGWWIFAIASAGALTITLLTVSFQAIKAAVVHPARSLKVE
ncbi:ABC transporter permease [Fulvivirgaceae bacterium PWU4]|uniref:ABC transporter permease n=1 Tax=Chryseosolibacter histidini TaxID=2782349 RepID=A0AAP2DLS7_9BACT|nr:ABC transporter permease [Chryseosolibacter histidini]MBT1697834.1 ABC transporter permease [Chryseosolibacter histidini]